MNQQSYDYKGDRHYCLLALDVIKQGGELAALLKQSVVIGETIMKVRHHYDPAAMEVCRLYPKWHQGMSKYYDKDKYAAGTYTEIEEMVLRLMIGISDMVVDILPAEIAFEHTKKLIKMKEEHLAKGI